MKSKTVKKPIVEVSDRTRKRLKYLDIIEKYGSDILSHPRFLQQKDYYQHGNTTTYDHVILVADKSLRIAKRWPLKVNEESLVRSALLHDYYLYDWHHPGKGNHFHPFRHGGRAKANAIKDFSVSKREQNAIKHHMFPLTLVPPIHSEGWIITIADKTSAMKETTKRRKKAKKVK